jgi:hypothetical protein
MTSRRPVRSVLPIAFGVTVIVAVGFADTAVALPAPPTTVVRHTTATVPVPKPGHIVLLPPTTAVLTTPVSAAAAGVTPFGPAGPTPQAGMGAHPPTLPHTL